MFQTKKLMTNYLYSVDVRQVKSKLKGNEMGLPTQEELHEYVIKELNFFKGQLNEETLESMHVIAIPYYGETNFSFID